ncbi:TolC family protein [Pontixanthobacter sp. CEM42]|uniref:efflux transporter outer membrane subunit n=1 Tax=Pontixanthobacter sp. CEM42 TaxID=2792077 RepID=UPI001AE0220F|nr:TolC family protein [Pontixanthobacter sp. CEM42]
MARFRTFALAAATLPLNACISMAPAAEAPSIVSEMPAAYSAAEIDGAYRPTDWWKGFSDPVLNSLVNDALSNNLDIAGAAARVEQASAQARIARSALFPAVSASAGTSYSDSPLAGSAFGGFGGGTIDRLTNETYSLSIGAAYELDLFGRVRGDLAAARNDAIAAEFDFRSVQLASAAETISTYFEIVDTRRQIELTVQTAELLADRAERTNDRYARGLAESLELYQVRQDLRNTQASLPRLEAALTAGNGRLATLVRAYPTALRERLDTALTPRLVFEPVPAGLPSDILAQRPDVAAAWTRLEAARQRIGARKAERFPTLQLNASLGSQSDNPGSVFDFADNWLLSLGSTLAAPIFDAGRISANIRAARAAYDQQAAAYAKAVLTAYREVEVAIDDYEEKRQRYDLITGQLAEARSSLELQSSRFEAGVGSYTAYLDALRAVYQVESSLSSAARDVALSRLGIHRALGGDWTSQETLAPLTMVPTAAPKDIEGNAQ